MVGVSGQGAGPAEAVGGGSEGQGASADIPVEAVVGASDEQRSEPATSGPQEAAAKPAKPRRPRHRRHLSVEQFRTLEAVLVDNGYAEMIRWSEGLTPPTDAKAFASEAIYVICNSGMRVTVANPIYWKCLGALRRGHSAVTVFGHPGKSKAIDFIWTNRKVLFAAYQIAENKLAYCATLPWIGPVTKFHLGKNLGLDVAKPDVHLERLARGDRVSVVQLCARLSVQTGYRVTTVDSILWRACANGHLDSSTYIIEGFDKAFVRYP